MKNKNSLLTITLLSIFFFATAFTASMPSPPAGGADKINWMTWEEAVEKNKKVKKKIFVDLYTSWCGWCVRMDQSTFADKEIVEYMNKNFYAVKFDAEQKEDLVYNNHVFKFVPSGRRGVHQFAATLLENKMTYPSFAVLNEKEERITIITGYQGVNEMLCSLNFLAQEKYLTTPYNEFKESWTKTRNQK